MLKALVRKLRGFMHRDLYQILQKEQKARIQEAKKQEKRGECVGKDIQKLQSQMTSMGKVLQILQSQMTSMGKVLQMERESLGLLQGNVAELSDLIFTPQNLRSSKTHDKVKWGDISIDRLLRNYSFQTVLDIGCGEGKHSDIFLDAGKDVTAIDYGESPYFRTNRSKVKTIVADFNTYEFDQQFDCVWCCHVLEHQLNPHNFLKKIHAVLKEGGVLCITVPPAKQRIVGGHVSLWNAGLLLYHLVLAGFDCSEAETMRYEYNVSVIVQKRTVDVMDKLVYDAGDISTIRPYLPSNVLFYKGKLDISFDGDKFGEDENTESKTKM